jgi:hypothetical protein
VFISLLNAQAGLPTGAGPTSGGPA